MSANLQQLWAGENKYEKLEKNIALNIDLFKVYLEATISILNL
jgi:hypothetical protein